MFRGRIEYQLMYTKTYYAMQSGSPAGATNEELRERSLIGEIFPTGEAQLPAR